MNTIHKYVLPSLPRFAVELPLNSQFLSAQMQDGKICVWLRVTLPAQMHVVNFALMVTGEEHDASPYPVHWGTVQNGDFVFHLFSEDLRAKVNQAMTVVDE